jgi:hypothetical protein
MNWISENISWLKDFIGIFFSAVLVLIAVLTYVRARQTILQPLRSEVIKRQADTLTRLFDFLSGEKILIEELNQKNRIALILLDSTLEIAFKEYLVNDSGHHYSDTDLLKLFKNRKDVETEVDHYVPLARWIAKIDYYYALRCKLIHERASAGISDQQVNDCRKVVQEVLKRLFNLRFNLES